MIDLDQGPCAIKRLRGCGCGNEYVAVTPEGDIYPCHQFVGDGAAGRWATCWTDTFDLWMKKARFAKANVYSARTECRNCWAKFYCSAAAATPTTSSMKGIFSSLTPISCELEKKRLECAIMMKAALAQDEM